MSTTSIITVHGINVSDQSYSKDLVRKFSAPSAVHVRSVFWSDILLARLNENRAKYSRPSPPWWRLYSKTQYAMIDWFQATAEQSLLYMWDEIQKQVISRVVRNILSEKKRDPKKIIFVGHSLGSVIIHDVIKACQAGSQEILPAELIGGIVTMGSPISQFPHTEAKTLKFAGRWINILGTRDPIARPIAPDDPRVEDVLINTGSSLINAHGGYWSHKEVFKIIQELI